MKKTIQDLPLIKTTKEDNQLFARKIVVLAYYLEKVSSESYVPYFLMTVIVPKQAEEVINNWHKAKKFELPRGFSLIKGTREMIYDGIRTDVPKTFNRYFRQLSKNKVKKKKQDKKVSGLLPAVLSAMVEAKEEAGVRPKHIKQILDLGIQGFQTSKGILNISCFALELKKPVMKKAKDSLAVRYFSFKALKLGALTRTRYNIPLLRPRHVQLIEKLYKPLKKHYANVGITLRKNDPQHIDYQLQIMQEKNHFLKILKRAKKGEFIAQKCTKEETKNNIIVRTRHSLNKINLKPYV